MDSFEMVLESKESWATSVPAENVQALAAATDQVPEEYIRPELDVTAAVVEEGDEMIPIIDMSRLLNPCYSHDECSKLDSACKDWGFFQLVNHGMPDGVMERMKVDVEEFFKLPLEEKQAFAPSPNGVQGYGQKVILAEEKQEWHDMLFLFTLPRHTRSIAFWPTSPATFRPTLDSYSEELTTIASVLFGVIAKNLGVNSEVLSGIFTDQSMKMNYYPPCIKAERVLGGNPHSDASGLTLLLQVRDVPGLQIKRDGKWLQVTPLERALIVNVGDSLEVVSNGKYKSIEHRIVVNKKKERISIAAYHNPSIESMVGPLPEILKGEDERYKTMTHGEYLKFQFSAKVEGKNHMDDMRLNK